MSFDDVFQGRTIGFISDLGWIWRGPGYDEGWNEPSRDDLVKVHNAIGEYLNSKHTLDRIEIETTERAAYYCVCGAAGFATFGSHVPTETELRQQAKFNHNLHKVRTLIREGESG